MFSKGNGEQQGSQPLLSPIPLWSQRDFCPWPAPSSPHQHYPHLLVLPGETRICTDPTPHPHTTWLLSQPWGQHSHGLPEPIPPKHPIECSHYTFPLGAMGITGMRTQRSYRREQKNRCEPKHPLVPCNHLSEQTAGCSLSPPRHCRVTMEGSQLSSFGTWQQDGSSADDVCLHSFLLLQKRTHEGKKVLNMWKWAEHPLWGACSGTDPTSLPCPMMLPCCWAVTVHPNGPEGTLASGMPRESLLPYGTRQHLGFCTPNQHCHQLSTQSGAPET